MRSLLADVEKGSSVSAFRTGWAGPKSVSKGLQKVHFHLHRPRVVWNCWEWNWWKGSRLKFLRQEVDKHWVLVTSRWHLGGSSGDTNEARDLGMYHGRSSLFFLTIPTTFLSDDCGINLVGETVGRLVECYPFVASIAYITSLENRAEWMILTPGRTAIRNRSPSFGSSGQLS